MGRVFVANRHLPPVCHDASACYPKKHVARHAVSPAHPFHADKPPLECHDGNVKMHAETLPSLGTRNRLRHRCGVLFLRIRHT